MNFQLLINGSPYLSGEIPNLIIIIAVVLIVLVVLIDLIWRKLRENEKLKYEFITIIAHKFRTPLTSVKWACDALFPIETDEFKKENFHAIQESNEKLIALTGTLIEITDSEDKTKTNYTFERIPLIAMVKGLTETAKKEFHEKNIFLSVQSDPDEIFVSADRSRLEFVLQTILENARIYTTPGRNVEVFVSRKGGKALVSVVDHGIGIEQKDIGKVFSKFFRTKNAARTDTEGFGIGLYLAKKIIQRLKGRIDVYSEGVDKGSTFTITLPTIK
jgi:signal transduction histidine kinase